MTYKVSFLGGPLNGQSYTAKDLNAIQVETVLEHHYPPLYSSEGWSIITTVYVKAAIGPLGEFIFQPESDIEKEAQDAHTG